VECYFSPRSSITSTGKRLSLLAPFLKLDYHWTNTDYANILIGYSRGLFAGADDPGPHDRSHRNPARP